MYKTRIFLSLILTLASSSVDVSAQNELNWVSRTGTPNYGRTNAAHFELNGKLYFGCGRTSDGKDLNDFWMYDPESNTWTQVASYPGGGRFGNISFSVNNRGYVGLGYYGSLNKDLYEYNPDTDSWTKKADFPGGVRYNAVELVIGDSAYVGTGSNGTGTGSYTKDFYMYDPVNDKWEKKADFPGGNCINLVGFSLHGHGYFGNMTTTMPGPDNKYWKYNKNTDQWTSIAALPGPARRISSAFTYKNRAYVGCGTYSGSPVTSYLNDFYQYNTSTDTWVKFTSLNGFSPRISCHFFSLGDTTVFAVGGAMEFGVNTDCWQLKARHDTCDNYLDTTLVVVYDTVTMSVKPEEEGGDCGNSIKVKVFPNPSMAGISIASGSFGCLLNYDIIIMDQLGKVVDKKKIESSVTSFDLVDYPRSVYFLKCINTNGGTVFVRKFMLQ